MTLALAAFARLAFAEGNPEQAALLAGAAEGLRRRVGLQAWPLLRRGEAEVVAQIRQALGTDRFDEVFTAGARLNRRQARNRRPGPARRRHHGVLSRGRSVWLATQEEGTRTWPPPACA